MEAGAKKVLIVGIIAILVVAGSLAALLIAPSGGNKPPVPVIDSPRDMDSFAVGDRITFNASSSHDPDGEIVSYSWDFGDNHTESVEEPVVTHVYSSPGLYRVKLTVEDNRGAKNSTSIRILILQRQEVENVTVAELWHDPESYSGEVVHISNAVHVDGPSWSFSIVDPGGYRTFRVYVEKGGNKPAEVERGDILEVQGLVTYYSKGGYWEIKIRNGTSDFARVVGHSGAYSYANATLESIDDFRACLVSLKEVKVVDVKASFLFTVGDGRNVTVYVERGAEHPESVSKGDIVNVSGFYTYYSKGGYWEIKVRNGTTDSVELVGTSGYREATISDLLSNPEEYEGSSVVVKNATVTSIERRNEEGVPWLFHVSQGNETITVYSEKGGNVPAELQEGDIVDVWALFTYYENGSYWELKIRAGTDDRVEIVSHGHAGYQVVTVHELNEDPEGYNGTKVAVLNTTVVEVLRRNETTGVPWLFLIGSQDENVTVYCEKGSNVSQDVDVGSKVNVYGVFTYYAAGGYYEIKVRAGTEDRVELAGAVSRYNSTSVEALLEDPQSHVGSWVEVEGPFVYGAPYKFYVTDEGGNRTLKVYVELGGQRPEEIHKGDGVRVRGIFQLHEDEYEIFVRNGTSDSVILLGRKMSTTYLEVGFSSLSSSPDSYNHTLIETHDLVVIEKQAPYKYVVGNLTISDWTFVLYYERGSGAPELEVGECLEDLMGFFTYFGSGGYHELVVRNGTSDTVVPCGASRYTEVSLPDLVVNRTSFKGLLVKTVGVVTAFKIGSQGALSYFYVTDPNTTYTLKVYVGAIENKTPVELGDRVEVQGLFTEYRGEFEISLREGTEDSYAVVGEYDGEIGYVELSLPSLIDHKDEYLYMLVEVRNLTVEEVHSSYIIVSSGSYSIEIYFENGTPSWVEEGQVLWVRGHFKTYDTGTTTILEIGVRANSSDLVSQEERSLWLRGIALSAEGTSDR